jgi:hypothetical protein
MCGDNCECIVVVALIVPGEFPRYIGLINQSALNETRWRGLDCFYDLVTSLLGTIMRSLCHDTTLRLTITRLPFFSSGAFDSSL